MSHNAVNAIWIIAVTAAIVLVTAINAWGDRRG